MNPVEVMYAKHKKGIYQIYPQQNGLYQRHYFLWLFVEYAFYLNPTENIQAKHKTRKEMQS